MYVAGTMHSVLNKNAALLGTRLISYDLGVRLALALGLKLPTSDVHIDKLLPFACSVYQTSGS